MTPDFCSIKERCLLLLDTPPFLESLDRLEAITDELAKSPVQIDFGPKTSFNPECRGYLPKSGYIVCYVPRSGSTHLCATLHKLSMEGHGSYGHPGEIFNSSYILDRLRHYGGRTLDDYFKWALWECSDRNGIFGVKGDLYQLLPFFFTPTFRRLLPETKFVFLTRRDLSLQAISYVIAQRTNLWTSKSKADRDYVPDYAELLVNLKTMAAMQADWEVVFNIFNIDPLRMTYEDIDTNLPACISAIGRLIGRPAPIPEELDSGLNIIRTDKNYNLKSELMHIYGL